MLVEHVLGGFSEIDDPLGKVWRTDAESHVLRIGSARRVVVAADSADAAGDEVGIARVFALHENAVAAEDRGGAVTLDDLAVSEIDFGEDAETADDSGYRIPIHLHDLLLVTGGFPFG
jgi:hypothetical protein